MRGTRKELLQLIRALDEDTVYDVSLSIKAVDASAPNRNLGLAERIWAELWSALGDRRGFGSAMDACDPDIQHEITTAMVDIEARGPGRYSDRDNARLVAASLLSGRLYARRDQV